uniref:Uncharacterized protein n=1 Tax=Arundo donax TaxID=35708 RepID=A0A0A9DMR4_ARUDO
MPDNLNNYKEGSFLLTLGFWLLTVILTQKTSFTTKGRIRQIPACLTSGIGGIC